MKIIKISTTAEIDQRLAYAKQIIEQSLPSGPVLIQLMREKRSIEQNALIHAMIADIRKYMAGAGLKYGLEEWKALLVDSFEQELFANGEQLKNGSKVITSLDSKRVVTIRPSTARFRKKEASDFVEYLFKFGAEHGVKWSDYTVSTMLE